MPAVSTQQLSNLQSTTEKIRNICILAHVDHGIVPNLLQKATLLTITLGKTTLSDSLLASNGIISAKISGKARYLDFREDEQQRGITMKSSGISLFFQIVKNVVDVRTSESKSAVDDYLINLIDSPGHVDFSSEVSSASRLCDGALVLVDAVEGVCTQTHSVLRQAWDENVQPILVFNKIDRLITELKLTANEAYEHLDKILVQVNAVMGTFFSESMIESDARRHEEKKQSGDQKFDDEWQLEIEDDSSIYFSPERGNVIFASAIDGWAFRTDQFAQLYASKLKVKEDILKRVLWGDYYLDPKAKRVIGRKGLKGRVLKPLFVQFVLDNIWAVYDAVLTNDREKVEKIVNTLNIKVLPRDLKSKDLKILLQAIMQQWLPLSPSVLLAVVDQLPSPKTAQAVRLPKILHPISNIPGNKNKTEELTPSREALDKAIYECDSSVSAPTVIFVSKMFSVPKKMLASQNSGRIPLTPEELQIRKQERMLQQQKQQENLESNVMTTTEITKEDENTEKMIGFSRIYSGTVKVGDTINVLGPKYDPKVPNAHCHSIKIESLYLLMGRELHELKEVPAGNVFGIGGLEKYVHKTATLSSSLECPSFGGLRLATSTILRVALEPKDLSQMGQLVEGLRILNLSDPSVEVLRQETGEHVIITSGELHLERCLKDLKEIYAKIDIKASEPIVSFRETISNSPAMISLADEQPSTTDEPQAPLPPNTVRLTTANKLCTITVRVSKLPDRVTNYIHSNARVIKSLVDDRGNVKGSDDMYSGKTFLEGMQKEFAEAKRTKDWDEIKNSIWAFGPKRTGPNILVSKIEGHTLKSWDDPIAAEQLVNNGNLIKDYESSILAGFQLATQSGPLCEEPMMGCCFFVENIEIANFDSEEAISKKNLLPGQIISTMREACRQVFLTWSPRLMLAMYSCELQAPSEVLGKVYGVLNKRKGKIIYEEMKEGTPFFQIRAMLPVVESFGFADELRKRTSGAASPQLIFSGYEVLELDPFWVPSTEEELEDFGEKADKENIAKKYMDAVRKRKGLFVEKRVVEHAEKQKTMRNK
ncbi:Elongation factor-like GTPase 1 [Nowakowskiella sp. JEL0407]|nr:Elongation factor-like GTPase 1 [Nowakowskiella sp. JEL0407]